MVKDLTEENMVVKEEDVENLVYNPVSYLRYNIEMDSTSPLKIRRRKRLSHTKSSKRPVSMVDLTASDIRKTQHALAHRCRSKTLIERVEDVGDKLKSAVHRTSSVDILHLKNKNNRKDDLLKPQTASDEALTKSGSEEQLAHVTNGRSLSCSDFPDLQSKATDHKKVVKTFSLEHYNKKTKERDLYSQTIARLSARKLQKPIITVDLAESNEDLDTNSIFFKYRLSSNCTESMGSLHSFRSDYGTDSDNEKYSSDSSSVFNSEHGHSDNFIEVIMDKDKYIEEQFYYTSISKNKRPQSVLERSEVEDVDLDLALCFNATSTPLKSTSSSSYLSDFDLTRERSKSHCVASSNEQKCKENISEKSKSEKDLFHINRRSGGSVPWFLQSAETVGLNKKWRPKSMVDVRKMRCNSDDLPDLKSLERTECYQSTTDLSNENLKNFIAKPLKDYSLFHKIFKRRTRSLPTKKTAPIFLTPNLSVKKRVMVESIV